MDNQRLEIYYNFFDDSHSMNAVIRNKAESELLGLFIEVALILGIDVEIESVAHEEGSLKEIWEIIGKNSNQINILLVIITVILSRAPLQTNDNNFLEKELTSLSIEEKKLNIKKLRLEIKKADIDTNLTHRATEVINISPSVLVQRSNFYKQLSSYDKIESIRIASSTPTQKEIIVRRKSFGEFTFKRNSLALKESNNLKISISEEEFQTILHAALIVYVDSIDQSISLFINELSINDDLRNELITIPFVKSEGSDSIDQLMVSLKVQLESIRKNNTSSWRMKMIDYLGSDYSTELCLMTMDLVAKYMMEFDIAPRGVDNYKVRYFMGIAIIELSIKHGVGLPLEQKAQTVISQLMLVIVMNQTLKVDVPTGLPNNMFNKITKTLMKHPNGDPIQLYYGQYGLYSIFKNVYVQHRT